MGKKVKIVLDTPAHFEDKNNFFLEGGNSDEPPSHIIAVSIRPQLVDFHVAVVYREGLSLGVR